MVLESGMRVNREKAEGRAGRSTQNYVQLFVGRLNAKREEKKIKTTNETRLCSVSKAGSSMVGLCCIVKFIRTSKRR